MNDQPLYQLEQVKRIIPPDKVILDIEALELPQGELTAIVGPNGAGKSTLLKILAFLEGHEQGMIRFKGRPVLSRDHVRLRREITMVDQAPVMFRGTVFKNVAYGLKVRGIPSEEWAARVAETLSLVDLEGFQERTVAGLSGGETQRVAIARALVFRPKVILLDEPTAGVDIARKEMVENLITELPANLGVTVLFSTHSLAQAFTLTDRVIHLAGGKWVPNSIENLFSGVAEARGDGSLVTLRSGVTVRLDSVRSGTVRFAIPAAEVVVEVAAGSADRTNRFDGTITRMELRGPRVRLLLSGDLNLRAEIAPAEFRSLGLELGSRVTATIPAEAIQLF